MSEYNDLMYRLEVAKSHLLLASNRVMGDQSALAAIDEAIHAIDRAVAIVGRQCGPVEPGPAHRPPGAPAGLSVAGHRAAAPAGAAPPVDFGAADRQDPKPGRGAGATGFSGLRLSFPPACTDQA
jgi:hypothetical protein